jgi:methanogenic corrinoid protein MtbC1
VARTLGKHRLIGLSEAIRFARSKGLPQSGLQTLARPGTEAVGAIDDRLCDRLTDALRRGDARRARAVIVSAHAAGGGAAPLADQLIRPVMERIGHGWEVGALDVFQEHLASHVVASALVELNEQASRSTRGNAPLAVGATPEGDPYLLPLLLGELALREQGWDVRNLGVNLPLRSLAAAVVAYRPALAFLSVNYLTDPDRFAREYRAFYESASAAGTAVVLGGRALHPDLRAGLVYTSFGDRIAHLSEFARWLAPAPDDASAPDQPGSAIS